MCWADAFHKACVEAGVPATADRPQYEGVGDLQTNPKRGLP